MKGLKRYLILPNPTKDIGHGVTKELVKSLQTLGGIIMFDDADADIARSLGCQTVSNCDAPPECLIVIGGDGTVIDAAKVAIHWNIPLVGVNMGHLGYLAEMEHNDLTWLGRLVKGDYTIAKRMMLSLKVHQTTGECTLLNRCALNEICLRADHATGIGDLTLEDNAGNKIRFRGDGLILATPSGSTAYSFSAGGPVIDPAIDAICVTPICPHSFFNRAMILGPNTVVDVANTSKKTPMQVSIDGRDALAVLPSERITVAMAKERLQMITFGDIPTFTTLRRKMELAEMKD